MDFKKLLDDYMKQLDCTAKDLAEKSGLSAATISRYRSGDRTPEDGSENFARLINGIVSIAESKGIPDISEQSVSDSFSPYVRNSVDIAHFQKNFHTLLTVVPINISDLARFLNFTHPIFPVSGMGKGSQPTLRSLPERSLLLLPNIVRPKNRKLSYPACSIVRWKNCLTTQIFRFG